MGLSSKQVSSDGQDWNQSLLQQSTNSTSNITAATEVSKQQLTPAKRQQQNQQQQQLAEPCPRCESTNTKFCYYNNYNKSQPRHFCKACKRHWTKGGTLRNVPVGGGRKNKRLRRTSNHSSSNIAAAATAKTTPSTHTAAPTKSFLEQKSNNMINHHHINGFAFPQLHDHKSMMTRGSPTSMLGDRLFSSSSTNLNLKSLYNKVFLDSSALSSLPLDHHHQNIDILHHRFPNTNLQNSFDHSNNTPCSVTSAMSNSFHSSPNLYNYTAGHGSASTSALEETVMAGLETSNLSGSSGNDYQQQRPWTPTTTTTTTATATTAMTTPISNTTYDNGLITPGNYVTTNWGWDDIDKFASVDITIPWDDEIEINL